MQAIETDNGWLLISEKGKHYLSRRHLNAEVNAFLKERAAGVAQGDI